jgi:bifunctional DNA-binding transcriptional regulator/antitoxin component of YhaV-PrlF toxin-antitoxin module
MTAIKAIMSQNGGVTFPPDVRAAAGLEHGGPVVIEVVDGELHVRSIKQVMDRASALARKLIGDQPGASVDDFLADRRREAEAED